MLIKALSGGKSANKFWTSHQSLCCDQRCASPSPPPIEASAQPPARSQNPLFHPFSSHAFKEESTFVIFHHLACLFITIDYISSNWETESEKVPPALSLLPIFLYSCGVTGETWIGTKSASCLRPWRPRDDWEAKESPGTQDQLTRDQRETPPSPPPPFPRALCAIPKFDTRKTFAPLFMFKTPEWRS